MVSGGALCPCWRCTADRHTQLYAKLQKLEYLVPGNPLGSKVQLALWPGQQVQIASDWQQDQHHSSIQVRSKGWWFDATMV